MFLFNYNRKFITRLSKDRATACLNGGFTRIPILCRYNGETVGGGGGGEGGI